MSRSLCSTGGLRQEVSGSCSVDLLPTARATRIVTPWMAAAGGGSIVHVSSVAALEAFGSAAAYSAVKLALISHSKTMAVTLASQKFA